VNKDNAHDYLPLVQALADGKTIQVFNSERWLDTDYITSNKNSNPVYYRLKPERERNEARSELTFRLERNTVQQVQLSELQKQLAEVTKKYTLLKKLHDATSVDRRNSVSESARLVELNHELTKERDIWKSRADAHQQDYEQMLRRIDVVAAEREVLHKNNAKLLTTIQENGLAEYGN